MCNFLLRTGPTLGTNDELLECILDKFLTALLHNQCLLEMGDFIPLDVHPANKIEE
jgi:hypothetical protein